MIQEYIHKVQYYETDKMGVTHHSNYIRFMEEARVDFMDQIGYGYDRMESEGVCSPVINIECDFKKSTTYADVIKVSVKVIEISQIRIKFEYVMRVEDEIVFRGTSSHCCLNKDGKIISLKREKPEVYELFLSFLETDENL